MSNKGQSGMRASFSGKIGYVLAVAGSAVGLGNSRIWLQSMVEEFSFSYI